MRLSGLLAPDHLESWGGYRQCGPLEPGASALDWAQNQVRTLAAIPTMDVCGDQQQTIRQGGKGVLKGKAISTTAQSYGEIKTTA